MRRAVVVVVVAILALAIAAVAAFHEAVAGAALRAAGLALGYHVAFDRLNAGLGAASVAGFRISNRAGEPVFSADRIELHYALRDLFPGSRHRYGLSVVEVARPELTLIHHPDGTYNVPFPSNPANSQPNHTPLALRARIRDGSVLLIDRYVVPGHERRQRLEGLTLDLAFAPHERSFYDVRFALDDGRTTHPVHGKATFDDDRGYEAQRWSAPLVPIGPLVDFALSSHAIDLVDGDLRDVDARFYTVVDPDGTRHLSTTASAQLERGKVYVEGLVAPVRDAHGPLVLFDDGLTTTGIDATLARTPLHMTGGVYGWRDPHVDFAVAGGGPLTQLRAIAVASRQFPVAGNLTFWLRAQGRLAQPFVSGSFAAPTIVYRNLRFTQPNGALALQGKDLDLIDVRAGLGALTLAARGRVQLDRAVTTDLTVGLSGGAANMQLAATVHLYGTGTRLATDGVVFGDGPGAQLAGVFAVDANGNGDVGPVTFERSDGATLYARFVLDQPHHDSAGIIDAHGPMGTVTGWAASEGETLAFEGNAATSFERLRPFTGDFGARGGIAIPLRVLASGGAIVAQVPRIGFTHASVRGVALHDGSATVVVRNGSVEVRAARLELAGGSVVAQGTLGARGELRATGAIPFAGGRMTAIARLRGDLGAPHGNVGIALAGAHFGSAPVSANVLAHYAAGRLTLHDAVALAADAIVSVGGEVRGLARGQTPAVDLHATVRGAQIATLARIVHAPLRYPEGELDADVHATGPVAAPHLAGSAQIARGSLNGLDFSDAHVALSGDPAQLEAHDGSVTVGSTTVGFSGAFGTHVAAVALRAPHADLADFNDYFDGADTLAGQGHVALDADLRAGTTSGDIAISGARYRAFALGAVDATWHTTGGTVAADARVAGPHGSLHVNGSLDPRRALDADAQLAGLDIGAWLNTAGINAPVSGILDATAHAAGSPETPTFTATATVRNGVVAHYAFDRVAVTASGDRSSTHVNDLQVTGPGLDARGSGTFGYGVHDPIALTVHATSNDLALLAKHAGFDTGATGSATTDLTLSGTRSAPHLAGTVAATNLAWHGYTVPRVTAAFAGDPASASIRNAEVDLQRGRVLFAAAVPLESGPAGLALGAGSLNARVQADRVDLAQFAGLLPKGSHAAGLVNGTVTAGGTVGAPSLGGGLVLTGGNFSSPVVRSPFANVRAQLALAGTQARLSEFHADVGGGTLDLAATATVGDLHDPARSLAFDATLGARKAGLDIANEFQGKLDATLHATQARGAAPSLAGNVALSQARIPLSAVLPPSKPSTASSPLPIAFDLGIELGSDVRVQSQNVDIGARGQVQVAGTLAKPVLDGSLSSTDGTVSFYRTFVVQRARVAFAPANGIVPDVDATATTQIPDPSTRVLLHVTGPATHLNLALDSDPSYDRAQILGLLVNAQALGAVPGIAATGGPSGASLASLGAGYLSGAFTRQLLQPLGGEVGRSLGLSDLALGYDISSGLSVGASRSLGKHINLSVNQSFGAAERQSLALEGHLSPGASVQLSVFGASGTATQALPLSSPLSPTGPNESTNLQLQALAPPPGSSGFVLTYLRRFQ